MRKVAMEMMEGEGKRLKRGIAQSERVKRMYEEEMRGQEGRRERGEKRKKGGYQERTSQVAVKWRIIIVASSVSRILSRTSVIKLPDIVYSARRRVKKLLSQVPEIPTYGTNGFYAAVHSS